MEAMITFKGIISVSLGEKRLHYIIAGSKIVEEHFRGIQNVECILIDSC